LYAAVQDDRTRDDHAAMDGYIARRDDPIWEEWRPPNGYQCRCKLIALTEVRAERYLAEEAERMQRASVRENRITAIMNGPDKGWQYDPCQELAGGILDAAEASPVLPQEMVDAWAERLAEAEKALALAT
jgi:uncharacterized protein with gpF-like domain